MKPDLHLKYEQGSWFQAWVADEIGTADERSDTSKASPLKKNGIRQIISH